MLLNCRHTALRQQQQNAAATSFALAKFITSESPKTTATPAFATPTANATPLAATATTTTAATTATCIHSAKSSLTLNYEANEAEYEEKNAHRKTQLQQT